MSTPSAPFALLDDAHSGIARLYTDFYKQIICSEIDQFDAACIQAEQIIATKSVHAVFICDYEFGVRLNHIKLKPSYAPGSCRWLFFHRMQRFENNQIEAWLEQQIEQHLLNSANIHSLKPNITFEEFKQAIAQIHQWLIAGETYELNYTFRLNCSITGSLIDLYRRLRQRQPVPFGALIVPPKTEYDQQHAIISLSPELFIQYQNGILTARPMKGTTAAGNTPKINQQRAQALAADSKNRAENLMIVDLLRNDLARIAQPGSVYVDQLFSVQQFSSVLQMTSTIRAQPSQQLSFFEIFRALFPCGSITGAPKKRTMELIHAIETTPRRLYTGAIGWIDAAEPPCTLNHFCFSVAIRTLQLTKCTAKEKNTAKSYCGTLAVGAGIVMDSQAEEEFAECLLKARFLQQLVLNEK